MLVWVIGVKFEAAFLNGDTGSAKSFRKLRAHLTQKMPVDVFLKRCTDGIEPRSALLSAAIFQLLIFGSLPNVFAKGSDVDIFREPFDQPIAS